MRFDENGDTLWTKWTGFYGGFNKVIKGADGLFYALMGGRNAVTNQSFWCIYVVTEEGIPITTIPLNPGANATLVDLEYRHGYFWLSGEKMPSIFYPPGLNFDFMLMKVRYDGSEVFSLRYNGDNPTSRGQKIEFMPNGNILFSGAVGNRIGAFEIDTAGNQIQYRTYVTNNFNSGWQSPDIAQMADGSLIVSGTRNTNPESYYLGKHDTSAIKIWGGINRGGLLKVAANQDSSVILAIANRPIGDKLVRLRSDSSVLWEINYSNTPLGGFKGLDDLWYEPDQSAVIVGYYQAVAFGHQNLYIAKFSNFGIPFDPTSAQALENLKTDAAPLPFPNPGGDQLKFTLLAGPGRVSFTDALGKTVWEGDYHPEKGINTRSFRPGVYHYRLERKGKVWGGKWVKE